MAAEPPPVKSGKQEENENDSDSWMNKLTPQNPSVSPSLSTAVLNRRRSSNSSVGSISTVKELHEIKELLRQVSQDVADLKDSFQHLHDRVPAAELESHVNAGASSGSLKPTLRKVTFVEAAGTIDELIKFKMECKNRTYDVIYNSRGQKTVVSPAHVDEDQIIKLSAREKVRIYVPGTPQPLQVVGEIATVVFKIGTAIFTVETVLHRERNIPVVLGREFGKQFIVSVNTEHKILTLKDDKGLPCAVTYELFLEP